MTNKDLEDICFTLIPINCMQNSSAGKASPQFMTAKFLTDENNLQVMIRAKIVISGDVQEAGYRAFVRNTAKKLGLIGFAENMPDGTVNVVCEGEKKKIETLVNSIKIKTETINVEKIDAVFENATGEFKGKGFVVKVDDLGQEMFQGYATSLKYFKIGWDKQDKMLEKQDKMLEKQDKMNQDMNKNLNQLNNTLTGFRDETKTEFQTVKTDYGKISQDLGKAVDSINTIAKSIEKLAEAIAKK